MYAAKKKVSDIKVHDRQRASYPLDEIVKRADSIQKTEGLLEPIVLDPADDSLVNGGCRRMAYILLASRAEQDRAAGRYVPEDNWESIEFVYKDQTSELFRQVCELEENIQRLALTWFEEAAAIAKIDELQRIQAAEKGEVWTSRQTAQLLDKSVGTVSQAKQIVEAAKSDPEIIKEEKLTGALRKLDTKKKLEDRAEQIRLKSAGRLITFPAEIVVGDSRLLLEEEPDLEYDAIATNFPFGVDFGASGKFGEVYRDDEDYIVKLVREIVRKSYRVLKDDSWFVGFFDIRKITYSGPMLRMYKEFVNLINQSFRGGVITEARVLELTELLNEAMGLAHWFEEAGFSYVRLMPIIWAKPNKVQGNIGDPRKGVVVAYEAAIMAAKGDAILLKQGKNDILVYDSLNPSERDFEMQMPVALCKELLSWFVMGGARILDPFAGVGSFGEGALELQCSFKGFELNSDRAATGNLRLKEHVFARREDV